ncbi:ROK family transcriptional regulator [Sphingobacterium luzhongxinii]|uniref:ROK family transcriptional regulator n=1 Tax=Sphingobacterium luzhongxinii TaxID=2654181 RepID=UPI0013DA5804|nr:ROK family transcriptional regulator [Sphingobacterium sp. xlx-73]
MDTVNYTIVRELYFSGTQSIADLSNSIGKSIPNITKTIQRLLEQKIITSEGLAPSTGGRRAIQYSLNTENLPCILAIALDQFNTTVTLVDFSNTALKDTVRVSLNVLTHQAPSELLLELVDNYLKDQPVHNIVAIGITMPGFIDSAHGINTSFTRLRDIRDVLQNHLHIPTYIENDSTAIAIAEHNFGKAKGSSNALVINLNWGVGLGMILENRLFRGSTGFAGEFSHIPLSNINKLCSCGKRGCLEVEASLIAAIEYATLKLEAGEVSQLGQNYKQPPTITIDQLMEAAINGDQVAIESFAKIGYMLGKGIATLIHIINPEKIIISGKGAKVGAILLPQIQASILEFSIHRLSKNTSIEISDLTDVQIIGSTCIAISSIKGEVLNKKIKKMTLN